MDERYDRDDRDERDGWVELTRHVRSTHGIPDDAKMMGLDRNTEEGAMVGMAGSLNPSKRSHRVVAWVILASFVWPVVYTLVHVAF